MKHKITLFIALFLTLPLVSRAYDFSVVYSGKTLYFNIVNGEAVVTCEGVNQGQGYSTNPTGAITIPSSVTDGANTYTVTAIGDHAFSRCNGLTSVTIPNTVTSIGEYAFSRCTGLTLLVSEATVPPTLSLDAFSGVPTDIPVYVPCGSVANYQAASGWSNFTNIQEVAGCSNTVTASANDDAMGTVTGGGSYSNGATATLTATPNCGYGFVRWTSNGTTISTDNPLTLMVTQDTTLTAEFEAMDKVQVDALWYTLDCANGTASVMPENSTYPFYSTNPTGDITIPSSISVNGHTYPVTVIGRSAFEGCGGITSVTIPASVTEIEAFAFLGCYQLQSVTIPSSVTTIGGSAFRSSGLTSITIPSSVTSIAGNVFVYSKNLTSITVEAGNTIYDSRDDCNAIIETTTNKLITGCSNTDIPNTVTTIGAFAFSMEQEIPLLTIPSSVTDIENDAFYICSNYTSAVVVDANNTTYDSRNNCNAIVESSSNTLVFGCKNTVVPNTVTAIGPSAFEGCIRLTSITIPASVTLIGRNAFRSTGLTEITSLATEPPTVGNLAFYYVSTDIPVNVPCGSLAAYQAASGWSNFTNIQELFPYTMTVTSNDETMGTVSVIQAPSCSDNVAQISATAGTGYVFERWSDGNTNTHRTVAVVSDTAIVALFEAAPTPTVDCDEYRWPAVASPYPEVQIKQKHDHLSAYAAQGWDTVVSEQQPTLTLSCMPYIPVRYFNGTYTVEEIPYSPADPTFHQGTRMPVSIDDGFGPATMIPYPFYFFGERKTGFVMSGNGMMTFNTAAASQSCAWSYSAPIPWPDGTAGAPQNLTYMRDAIYGVYEDILPSSSTMSGDDGMYYSVRDNYPARKIVCSWNNIPLYSCTSLRNSYQIVCHEGTNIIEVHVKNRQACTSWQNGRGIIGIQNATGLPQEPTAANPHVVSGSPAAFYPAGKNPFATNLTEVAYRFTPQGQSTYTYKWYRVFDDGRDSVELTTDVTNPNGYIIPMDANSSCPTLTRAVVSPTEPSKYVFELRFTTANGDRYCLYDTCVVGVEETPVVPPSGTTVNVTVVKHPDGNIGQVTPCDGGTCQFPAGEPVSFTAEALDANYQVWGWIVNGEPVGALGQGTISYPSLNEDLTVHAWFYSPTIEGSEDYLIYNDDSTIVTGIWPNYRTRVTSITIDHVNRAGQGVHTIAAGALAGCTSLESIFLPPTLTTIGANAFNGCIALTSVDIPTTVTTIGEAAFAGCAALQEAILPEELTAISNELFHGCASLGAIVIPSHASSIGSMAFSGCSNLFQIRIPANVETVGNQAFSGCTSLRRVDIEAGIQSFGEDCFRGCTAIGRTSFIGDLADYCAIEFDNAYANPAARSRNLFLGNDEDPIVDLVIPDGVSGVNAFAFFHNTQLETLTLPATVTHIDSNAFYGVTNLIRIIILGNPEDINVHADAFSNIDKNAVVVEVPCAYYENHAEWNGFTHLVGPGMPVLRVVQRPGGYITVTNPDCGNAPYTFHVAAQAMANYVFHSWSDGVLSPTRDITLTEDMTLSAIFDRTSNGGPVIERFFSFETTADVAAWYSVGEGDNEWVVGDAVSYYSNKSLYVSKDHGRNANYNLVNSPYAYTELNMKEGAWRINFNYNLNDVPGHTLTLALLPIALDEADDAYAHLTPEGYDLPMLVTIAEGTGAWNAKERMATIPADGWYRLVAFFNVDSDEEPADFSVALDNISLRRMNDIEFQHINVTVVVNSNDDRMGSAYTWTGDVAQDHWGRAVDANRVHATTYNSYFSTDEIWIHAIPEDGYRFVAWNDGNPSADRPLDFFSLFGEMHFFTAYFEPIPEHWVVTVSLDGEDENGVPASAEYGVKHQIATANDNNQTEYPVYEIRHTASYDNNDQSEALVLVNKTLVDWAFTGWSEEGSDIILSTDNPYLVRYADFRRDVNLVAHMDKLTPCDEDNDFHFYATAADIEFRIENGMIVVYNVGELAVTLYDVNGRVVETKTGDGGPVIFEVPASGAYLVRVGDNVTRRVVVIR